ncbi:unnamed protein product, partial [marine sediment metagenome]
GKVCREYRDIGKTLSADWKLLDWIGIVATHLNASTFVAGLTGINGLKRKVHWVKMKPEKEALKEVKKHFGKKVVVAAGYEPGHSTDYDAAIFAEAVGADLLINASNIDGVYTADPKRYKSAKKLKRLGHSEFIKIIKKNVQAPGEYRLFDLPAAKTIKKAKIKTIIIDGKDPEEILRAVEGKHNGTVIG